MSGERQGENLPAALSKNLLPFLLFFSSSCFLQSAPMWLHSAADRGIAMHSSDPVIEMILESIKIHQELADFIRAAEARNGSITLPQVQKQPQGLQVTGVTGSINRAGKGGMMHQPVHNVADGA